MVSNSLGSFRCIIHEKQLCIRVRADMKITMFIQVKSSGTSQALCKQFNITDDLSRAAVATAIATLSVTIYHTHGIDVNMCLSLTVVSQSEVRVNTEHGIRNRYVPLLNHNNAWQSANRVHNSWKWICVNSLWTSDAKWRHGFIWTLVQVAVCCLAAPSHYQSWCWIIIRNVSWN